MKDFISILCGLSILIYLFVRLKYELQMMQQNSYRNNRYMKWLKSNIFSQTRIVDAIIMILLLFFADNIYFLISVSIIMIIKIILGLRKKYKKKLVFTNRVIRLFITSGLVVIVPVALVYVLAAGFNNSIILLMLLSVLSFGVVMLANILNAPIEKSINRGYYNDAKRILEQHKKLIIIGITGSYGKTSTKHYLHRILSEKFNVLMTPGSFNTTLGVIRTIRENLKSYHEIFIVEMGAKQAGDIKEICELVNPRIGILTSIGEQHLESFKTIQNVQKTKFELIDSLPPGGFAVLNDDFEYVANRKVDNVKNVARYSFANNHADYYLDKINYTKYGTEFAVSHKGQETGIFTTKIVGSHNLTNILAGYIVAKHLGMEDSTIKYGISHIEQVEHRLNITHTAKGITIIDDAFNSNPQGAKMALDVIKGFQTGKRIVVTPGMIELGEKQYDYNYNFGTQMASSCDYAIIVGQYNREAITKGLKDSAFDEGKIYLASTFNDAVIHLNTILSVGDVVLYENDLPDTFK